MELVYPQEWELLILLSLSTVSRGHPRGQSWPDHCVQFLPVCSWNDAALAEDTRKLLTLQQWPLPSRLSFSYKVQRFFQSSPVYCSGKPLDTCKTLPPQCPFPGCTLMLGMRASSCGIHYQFFSAGVSYEMLFFKWQFIFLLCCLFKKKKSTFALLLWAGSPSFQAQVLYPRPGSLRVLCSILAVPRPALFWT